LTLVRRELLDRLKSNQFVVLLVVSTILFSANGLVFSSRHNRERTWYAESVAEAQREPSTTSTTIFAAPSPLTFVSEGGHSFTPSAYVVKPLGVVEPSPGEPRNHKMPETSEVDWSFIIRIVFSLYVLLLGYSAVSGEKQQGTLRLTLSYPVGRLALLAAKYCAILLTIAVPLMVGVLISLIITWAAVPELWTAANLTRIALTLMLAAAYLSLFALLSLLVSSLVGQSSLVLLLLLVVWVFFVVLVPNAAGILSEGFSPVSSEYQVARQVAPMIKQQVGGRVDRIRERIKSGEVTTEEQVQREAEHAYEEGQQDLIKHYESYRNAMGQRSARARAMSRLSPATLFQYASESMVGTGTTREERCLRDVRAYSRTYDAYILAKVGKLVGVSGWSFSDDVDLNGKKVFIRSPWPEEYKGDMSDFPRFRESKPSLIDGIKHALPDLLGLILWNLVLAAAAFWAILRADVR
jgi:ABC-type transport system involved in multi-copper enzyme maturation permease subunit